MINTLQIYNELKQTMEAEAAEKIASIIGLVYEELRQTVTKVEFNELKEVVRDLAQAQQDLAQAQQRTEQRMEELAEAQQQTEKEIRILAKGLTETRSTVGGMARSMAYALENEAYRMIPALLKEKYGLELAERMVRTTIEGEEINLFGRGKRNGQEVLLVGETKSRLDERRLKKKKKQQKDIFEQLNDKLQAVETAYPDVELVPLVVTHYARPGILKQLQDKGIIVIQSFEW